MVLLQRPTMLYPFSVLGNLCTPFHEQTPISALDQNSGLSLLRSFVSYEKSAVQIDSHTSSLQSLCVISLLASHCRRLPGSLSRYLAVADGHIRGSQGWRQEFLELVLQKWLSSHINPPSPSTLILYHVIHLSIYSKFNEIGRSAHFALTQKTPVASKSCTMLAHSDHNRFTQGETGSIFSQPLSTENCFTSEEDHEKAIWHANRILQVALWMERDTDDHVSDRVHLLRQAGKVKVGDVTHYSHAIYYATMVLWWSNTFKNTSRRRGESGKEIPTASQTLRQGIELLSRSASQVAGVFKEILGSLESRG